MIVNQLNIFGKENKIGKVEKPSKLAKEVARQFKCVPLKSWRMLAAQPLPASSVGILMAGLISLPSLSFGGLIRSSPWRMPEATDCGVTGPVS